MIPTTSFPTGYIKKATEFLRQEPTKDSTVVSEVLYGEEVNILKKESGWIEIKTKVDDYRGWIREKTLVEGINLDFSQGLKVKTNYHTSPVFKIADTEKGPLLKLPFGCQLKVLEEPEDSNKRWIKVALVDGQEGYIQRGDVTEVRKRSLQEVIELSKNFLDIPYAWGGRSTRSGYDCSGFIQMLFKEMGILLPRDSKDQINWEGFIPVEIEALAAGDLIFWGMGQEKIRHVGLYIGNGEFIHSGINELKSRVKIDKVNGSYWIGSNHLTYRTARRLINKI